MEFAFATIWESVADTIPDRPAVVQGDRRISWGDYDGRAARLAGALAEAGLVPGSKVALYLYNSPEYAEASYAAMKLRGVPVNVNYRYLDEELAYLIDNSDAEAVVFHSSLGERVEVARERSDRVRLWIEVDDGGTHLDGAEGYEDLIDAATPARRLARTADDPYILYTGGTTGMPKGVVYRQGPLVQSFLMQLPLVAGETPVTEATDAALLAARLAAEGRSFVALPACPLMHGTGAWIGLYAPQLLGGTTVLTTSRSLDPAELFATVEREAVGIMVIVGEAFARPMIRHLGERAAAGQPYDLSSLRLLISSGAMFSAEAKAALCEHIPTLLIVDTIGSSEGAMGQSMSAKGLAGETARFMLNPNTKVFTDDGREVTLGSGEAGLLAVGGANIPVGYYKDEVKSAATFREIDGVRYSFPGDWATVAADGTIVLLGRGGSCINTGGEKVYPEEVEEAVKTHPGVDDCLVFGVDDERFGQAVAAVASPVPGAAVTTEEIVAHARTRLAAYKVPKRLVVINRVPRTPSGKADYPAAKMAFAEDTADGLA